MNRSQDSSLHAYNQKGGIRWRMPSGTIVEQEQQRQRPRSEHEEPPPVSTSASHNWRERERDDIAERESRRLLARCVFAARRFRRRWKYDVQIQQQGERGQDQSRAGLILSETSSTVERTTKFEMHWKGIMIGHAEAPADFLRRHQYDTDKVLDAGEVAGGFSTFLGLVSQQKEGRAGGEDGTVAECVRHVTPKAKIALHRKLVETLTGARPQPEHWKRANVSLIPKLLQAPGPGDFRPIAALSVSFKLVASIRRLRFTSFSESWHRSTTSGGCTLRNT